MKVGVLSAHLVRYFFCDIESPMTETAAETNPVLEGTNFEVNYTKSLKIKVAALR